MEKKSDLLDGEIEEVAMSKKAIFEIITEHIDTLDIADGEIISLGNDFHLPQEEKDGMKFADGAWDGISIYHMGTPEITDADLEEIENAVRIASDGNNDAADAAFRAVCNRIRTVNFIDELQHVIVDNAKQLDASNVFRFALHLILESDDIESIKAGLMILELFDHDEDIKKIVRTIGLSDEFTLFSVFLMRKWDNGNTEIMNLAKAVSGWGKIHAVHYIEPDTDEIKYWLLTEAVSNYVMPAYSGLDCYKKIDLDELLNRDELTYEEVSGALAIIDAMLDEGPVPGISTIENPEDMLVKMLEHAAKHLPLQPWDCEAVNNISDWQEENGEDDNPDMEAWIDAILGDSETRELISEEVKKGNHIYLAQSIGLPYREELYIAMEKDFDQLYSSCSWLMDDENYAEKVIALYRKNMDLNNLQIEVDDSLGLGNADAGKLDFILQELKDKQGIGDDFVIVGLKSPVIRNRNGALNVLEAWVENNKRPLVKIAPEFYKLLTDIVDDEKEENIHNRMERLLSGKISFEDEDND